MKRESGGVVEDVGDVGDIGDVGDTGEAAAYIGSACRHRTYRT